MATGSQAGRRKPVQKKPFTVRRFLRQTKKFFIRLLRIIARGLYFGIKAAYTFIVSLPPRTLLFASSAFGLMVIVIIIAAIASPGSHSRASAADIIAAYQDEDQGAGGTQWDSGVTDPYADYDPAANAAVFSNPSGMDANPLEDGFTELKKGDDDPIIARIQARLMELGYMDLDEPTEHFGPLTASALKCFQAHNGLKDNGICGAEAYALLMGRDAKVYVMQSGDSGDDVWSVQQRFYELGFLDNKANITGKFGDKTEVAAKAFQAKNHLTADGKVGEKTLAMLYSENVVSNAYKLGDQNPVILACQQALKKLGYITFTPDGVMGKSTVSAIKSFQEINGLTKDGALGPETRDLLLSNDAQPKVIQLGNYGTDVKKIQERLIKLNYLTSGSATGYFGAVTEQAVRAFQKRHHLGGDGKVGATTLSLLNSSSAKKASAPVNGKKDPPGGNTGSGSGGTGSGSGSGNIAANKTGIDKLIALAESKIGCKYVRGSKGPDSFDCSGFVYWCMRSAGLSCSYQTSSMWASCTKYQRITSLSKIERGDILVFSGHVGIYLGSGSMIDASSSEGEVRRSGSVLKPDGYWQKTFICAYRVF